MPCIREGLALGPRAGVDPVRRGCETRFVSSRAAAIKLRAAFLGKSLGLRHGASSGDPSAPWQLGRRKWARVGVGVLAYEVAMAPGPRRGAVRQHGANGHVERGLGRIAENLGNLGF